MNGTEKTTGGDAAAREREIAMQEELRRRVYTIMRGDYPGYKGKWDRDFTVLQRDLPEWKVRVFSTMFAKEMLSIARRRRYFAARAAVLGLLVFLVWMSWDSAVGMMRGGVNDLSYLGNRLFREFVSAQLLAVALIVPALTAPVVAAERENDTLSLLLMTNMDSRNLLLDKLLSRVTLMGLILLSAAPIFMTLLSMGGIEPHEVLIAYSNIFATIILCCALGLWVSTYSTSTAGALIGTYVAMAIYTLACLLLGGCSAGCLMVFLLPVSYIVPGLDLPDTLGAAGLLFPVFPLIFLYFILRKCAIALPEAAAGRKPSWVRKMFGDLNEFFERINFTKVRIMKERAPLRGNAMIWRETQTNFLCSNIFMLRVGYSLMIASFFLFLIPWLGGAGAAKAVSATHLTIVTLVAIAVSSWAFTRERKHHTLEVLLSSPIPGGSMLIAKFSGIMRLVAVCALAPPAMLVVAFFCGDFFADWWWASLALYLLALAAWIPFVALVGLAASVKFAKYQTAMMAAVAVVGWIGLGPVLVWMAGANVPDMGAVGIIFSISPAVWMGKIFSDPADISVLPPMLFMCLAWTGLLLVAMRRFDRAMARR